ncbi:MAG: PQQ-binding-like beta-propeller repeat protein [Planctomycetaceae bacterium]|nr:PQQ-binding-like beta-propeller repeat protein [Planctomycetaceae bacterium]
MFHRLIIFSSWLYITLIAPFTNGVSAQELENLVETEIVSSAPVPPPTRKGNDWPIFLGPDENGHSHETDLRIDWSDGAPPVLWSKKIGTGYSAPSVRGNRLVIHHRPRNREIIECCRADTGETLWRTSYPTDYSDPYGYNNGPRCSPILTDKYCYTYGAEGKLVCTELETGKLVWIRDVQKDFQLPDWFFGVGCTPILEGNLLITLVGGQPNSGVVAFDARTGKTVWEAVGKETWDNAKTGWKSDPVYEWTGDEMVVSYSSPIAATIHGQRHILCLVRQGLVSLDPKTGQENFHYWFRSRTHESVNAARPVVVGDEILLSAAYRVGSALIKVAPNGKSVTEVWRDDENLLAHWSTPIYVDGYVYGFSGRHENQGELRCLEWKTGDVIWQTNGLIVDPATLKQDPNTGQLLDKESNQPVPWPLFGRGSNIVFDGHFLILGERGTLALSKINSKRYEEIGRTSYPQIGVPAWAAPVLSRKRVFLRDEGDLICLDFALRKAKQQD